MYLKPTGKKGEDQGGGAGGGALKPLLGVQWGETIVTPSGPPVPLL